MEHWPIKCACLVEGRPRLMRPSASMGKRRLQGCKQQERPSPPHQSTVSLSRSPGIPCHPTSTIQQPSRASIKFSRHLSTKQYRIDSYAATPAIIHATAGARPDDNTFSPHPRRGWASMRCTTSRP
jgi:hypothetical protein